MIQKWTVKQDEEGNGWNVFSPNGGWVMGYFDWKYAVKAANEGARESADKGLVTLKLPANGAGLMPSRPLGVEGHNIVRFDAGMYHVVLDGEDLLRAAETLIYHRLKGSAK